MPVSSTPPARILFMDDNVRDIGGHYLELASLLAEGAREIGYRPELVTHVSFADRLASDTQDSRLNDLSVDPGFRVRRMENWSLGVDGPSMCERDGEGRPVSTKLHRRLSQLIRDFCCRPSRRPSSMLETWATDFQRAVARFCPQADDRIVINTGGDFQMLALARALELLEQSHSVPRLQIHVLFHFAVFERQITDRAIAFGRQVLESLGRMNRHDVKLHATTEPLNQQLISVGIPSTAVPYPTRSVERPSQLEPSETWLSFESAIKKPVKILLAGMPRVEKGRDQIRGLIASLEPTHLRSGRFAFSMQLPAKRWQRMVPSTLIDQATAAPIESCARELEVLRGNLTVDQYHRWLDSAGVGLFLYDPARYEARCSGVLLEMMIRGVPVIVPSRCWLADQVQLAEASGTIGWVYDSIDQIPDILNQFESTRTQVLQNCRRYRDVIAQRHAGQNTLREMGVTNCHLSSLRQAV